MRVVRSLFVVVLLGVLVGCGGGDAAPKAVTPPSSTEQIKMTLNDVAQSGQLGSGGMVLEQEIENLRATDAAKADALKKDYEELKNMSDPGQAKSKAEEMLKKL